MSKLKRCEVDHPNRCQALFQGGQCPFEGEEISKRCRMHAQNKTEKSLSNANKQMYDFAKWHQKIHAFSEAPEVKSLRSEIGVLRLLLQETINRCVDDTDLLLASHKIGEIVLKIEKLVASCHRLEEKTGFLVDKTQILQFASLIIEIISRYITDADELNGAAEEILKVVNESSTATTVL